MYVAMKHTLGLSSSSSSYSPFILVLLSMYVFVFGSFVVLLHAGTAAATAVTMSTRSLFFSFFTIADRLKRYGAYEVVSFFFLFDIAP